MISTHDGTEHWTPVQAQPKHGDLQIWWIPQVPGRAFEVRVSSLREAGLLIDTLAKYDQFQLDNKIKPDYSNAGGVSVFEDGEWVDWYSPEGDDFDTWCANRE